MNVESGSRRAENSEKWVLTVNGSSRMSISSESSVGKTVTSSFCALAGTHNENTKSVIHNIRCDLICIFFPIFLLPIAFCLFTHIISYGHGSFPILVMVRFLKM